MLKPAVFRSSRRGRTIYGATVLACVSAALISSGPAHSAPDPACPPAFPTADLVADDPVTGLTVSKGEVPDAFSGKVLGVLDDGIAVGLDMIMVRLTSSEIDRVGIWAGMSGSPVYAEDGRLIGAVSYGLSFGPSTVAGVTPAANMQALLDAAPSDAAARTALTQLATLERLPSLRGWSAGWWLRAT